MFMKKVLRRKYKAVLFYRRYNNFAEYNKLSTNFSRMCSLIIFLYCFQLNLTLLQASVVEEIISFSALENIRDLTCVSLFAICFDDVTARFYLGKQAREVVQMFHKPAALPNQKKVNKISKAFLPGHQTTAVVADVGGETVYIETSEKQQEEILVTLNIGI